MELNRAPSKYKSDSIVGLYLLSHTARLPRPSNAESQDGKVSDGNLLLSVSFNDMLEVFDLDTGKLRCTAEVGDRCVFCILFRQCCFFLPITGYETEMCKWPYTSKTSWIVVHA